jgi:hypothetical protein
MSTQPCQGADNTSFCSCGVKPISGNNIPIMDLTPQAAKSSIIKRLTGKSLMAKDYIAIMAPFVVTNSVMATENPKNAGAPEAEITPEMIEAGRTVLLGEISVWFGPDYDSAEVAEKVFRAMIQARPSSC